MNWKLSNAALDRAIFAALAEQDKRYPSSQMPEFSSVGQYRRLLERGDDKHVEDMRRVWRVGFDTLLEEYLR